MLVLVLVLDRIVDGFWGRSDKMWVSVLDFKDGFSVNAFDLVDVLNALNTANINMVCQNCHALNFEGT